MAWSDLSPPAWTSSQPQSPLRQPFSEVLLAVGLIVILGTCGRMLFSGRRKMAVKGKVIAASQNETVLINTYAAA